MLNLKNLALRGLVWVILGYGISQLIRLASNLILTRILAPEMFGLMALMHAFIIGLSMFSDIGIGPSIIQNHRGDDLSFLNTAWTMQFLRGIALWLLCLVICWPLGIFYHDNRILWLLPITSLTLLITGLNSTALFSLNKHLYIGKLISLELVSQFISTAVMILWAWVYPSVWALVIGNLVASLIHMFWSHRLTENYTNRFCWDRVAAKEVLSFGKWVFFSTAMTFLSLQADNLILGKIFSLEFLGVYLIASVFANIPRQIIGQVSSKLIYPIISKQIHIHRRTLRSKILEKRRLFLLCVAPFLAFLIAFGDLIILTLYDARYAAASWMLPILALGLWPRVLSYTIDPVFLALAKPKYTAYGNLSVFIVLILGAPITFYFFGIIPVIVLIAAKEFIAYLVVYYGLRKEKMAAAGQDIILTVFLLALVVSTLAARELFGLGNFIALIRN